jgi:Tfp pilus assembly protein PilX
MMRVESTTMRSCENKMMISRNTVELRTDNFRRSEQGSAMVIALFVLALLSVFVALAMSRSAAEAAATGNETAEGRTFYAAQGSLESMTRNFNKVFEVKLNPTTAELDAVRNGPVPGLTNYTFQQELDQTSTGTNVVLPGGPFAGLYAVRDNWRLRTTATNDLGIQVQLTRNVLNNRVPIFQFGIFYDDDLELYRPPRFSFGGRVHSNANFYLSPGPDGVYFDSRVTAVGQIITQTWRNGNTSDMAYNQSWIKNASGVYKQLLPTMGSVLNTNSGNSNNIFASNPDIPPSKLNTSFAAQAAIFDGNLQNLVKPLKLPIKIDSDTTDLIEMIRRGKKIADSSGGDLISNAGALAPVTAATADSDILREERFANKPGIRVSLADSKAKLPGCASGSGTAAIPGPCGVELDGLKDGSGPMPLSPSPTPSATPDRARGYQPDPMKKLSSDSTYTYTPTRVNGERFYSGGIRQAWIKVETVDTDAATGNIITKDITKEFLSMGVTEQAVPITDASGTVRFKITDNQIGGVAYDGTAPTSSLAAAAAQPASTGNDSRAIIKLQRFIIPGPAIPNGSSCYSGPLLGFPCASYYSINRGAGAGAFTYNVIERYSGADQTKVTAGCATGCNVQDGYADMDGDLSDDEKLAHLKLATLGTNTDRAIVPFPIEMFDSREGEYYDDASLYNNALVTRNGVMSMIDIDVANLRRFFRGDFDGYFKPTTNFPSGLRSTDIPQRGGWIFYVSDRRGDADFNGQYSMEDVYGNNDGILQAGEDVNFDGLLQKNYMNTAVVPPGAADVCVGTPTPPTCEAPKYADTWASDYAAVADHKYYRRGVRLINGTTIPGKYDPVTPANTRGFTFASENGVYVYGNYNATGVTSIPATGNTPYNNYLPSTTDPLDIPASIAADAVTILSNSKYYASGSGLSNYDEGWNDGESFANSYDQSRRKATDTTIRFAMISGDSLSSLQSNPHQGGISPRLNGGVHNFKRYLERWTDPNDSAFSTNLNYSGSLINLFNSKNNNGTFKCCDTVYNPPVRNWVFDSTFLDPDRLPPGTPYFQYIQTTGFQRTNE